MSLLSFGLGLHPSLLLDLGLHPSLLLKTVGIVPVWWFGISIKRHVTVHHMYMYNI